MTCPTTTSIGGLRFDNVTMDEAVGEIVRMAGKRGKPQLVCTANVDHLARLRHDEEFRTIYDDADFIVADGMPIVWLSRLAGTPLKERVAGSDLFVHLAEASHENGLRLYFLGGQPGSAEGAAAILREQFPDVQIAGCYCPPIETFGTADEDERIVGLVRAADPDILLVGLGSPKQEKWIARHMSLMEVPVSIGVGASFDMTAGKVRRAPRWARRIGMEWLYRLAQEPGRLWHRYVGRDMPYLIVLAIDALRRSRRGDEAYSQSGDEYRNAA